MYPNTSHSWCGPYVASDSISKSSKRQIYETQKMNYAFGGWRERRNTISHKFCRIPLLPTWTSFSSYSKFTAKHTEHSISLYSKFIAELEIHINREAVTYSELSCYKIWGFFTSSFLKVGTKQERSILIGSWWRFVIHCSKYWNILLFYMFLMKKQKCISNSCFS